MPAHPIQQNLSFPDNSAAFATAGVGGILAFQVVYMLGGLVYPASSNDVSHSGRVIGIAPSSIPAGIVGIIQQNGPIYNPGWTLTPGATYYLGIGGNITITPPVIGFIQEIGMALDATTLIINIERSVLIGI